jgi:hypothetical protein
MVEVVNTITPLLVVVLLKVMSKKVQVLYHTAIIYLFLEGR